MAPDATTRTDGANEAAAAVPGMWIKGEFYPYLVSPEETMRDFHALAQKHFGISGGEFIRRLDAGEYDDIYDDPAYPEVMNLALSAQLVR